MEQGVLTQMRDVLLGAGREVVEDEHFPTLGEEQLGEV